MSIIARVQRMERARPSGRYYVISGWSREEAEAKKTKLRASGRLTCHDTLLSIAVIDGHQSGAAVTVAVRP